jgi:hypothetical protein
MNLFSGSKFGLLQYKQENTFSKFCFDAKIVAKLRNSGNNGMITLDEIGNLI